MAVADGIPCVECRIQLLRVDVCTLFLVILWTGVARENRPRVANELPRRIQSGPIDLLPTAITGCTSAPWLCC
ncbi:hypothetical protein BDW59DRAFT_154697 [Aspergillus cavernicola]|uniref:Uncharacterized protein n=1 Tax=Aspergillus cavernicola TaxID=176166 RepID=A0ABR4HDT2_9EURO